ncbi:hypothetical protein N7499_011032, partial [Penicillium canescens]
MTSPSSTIIIEDEELPPNWPSTDSQVQRSFQHTSPESPIEPNDTASGSIGPSRKRRRAAGKRSETLDTSFKKLRKTVDEKVKTLNQDIENLQQQVQELQNKLLLQEDRHQEELSQRRILDCRICYGQPDCWHIMLCGHMV